MWSQSIKIDNLLTQLSYSSEAVSENKRAEQFTFALSVPHTSRQAGKPPEPFVPTKSGGKLREPKADLSREPFTAFEGRLHEREGADRQPWTILGGEVERSEPTTPLPPFSPEITGVRGLSKGDEGIGERIEAVKDDCQSAGLSLSKSAGLSLSKSSIINPGEYRVAILTEQTPKETGYMAGIKAQTLPRVLLQTSLSAQGGDVRDEKANRFPPHFSPALQCGEELSLATSELKGLIQPDLPLNPSRSLPLNEVKGSRTSYVKGDLRTELLNEQIGNNEQANLGDISPTLRAYAPRVYGESETRGQEADVIAQIEHETHINLINPDLSGGRQELRVQLKPEHLGSITLKVSMVESVLSVDISTENIAVKSIIESHLHDLRHNLFQNGIEVGRLSISAGEDNPLTPFPLTKGGQGGCGKGDDNMSQFGSQGGMFSSYSEDSRRNARSQQSLLLYPEDETLEQKNWFLKQTMVDIWM